jgi:hypothetical protein
MTRAQCNWHTPLVTKRQGLVVSVCSAHPGPWAAPLSSQGGRRHLCLIPCIITWKKMEMNKALLHMLKISPNDLLPWSAVCCYLTGHQMNLRTFSSGVSPNPHQRTSRFHERPGSFLGSYSTCSKQRDHRRPYTHGLFDHHGYISKPDIFFLDNCDYQHNAWRGFGLIFDTAPLWLPPIENGNSPYRPRHLLQQVVLDRLLSGIGPVTNRACSIVNTQLLLGYGHCCCYHF